MQFHKKKQNENKHLLKLFFIAREKKWIHCVSMQALKENFWKNIFAKRDEETNSEENKLSL